MQRGIRNRHCDGILVGDWRLRATSGKRRARADLSGGRKYRTTRHTSERRYGRYSWFCKWSGRRPIASNSQCSKRDSTVALRESAVHPRRPDTSGFCSRTGCRSWQLLYRKHCGSRYPTDLSVDLEFLDAPTKTTGGDDQGLLHRRKRETVMPVIEPGNALKGRDAWL